MLVGIEGRKSCCLQGPCTQQGQRLNTTALCFQDTAGEEVHYLQQLVRRALGGPTSNQKAQGAREGSGKGRSEARADLRKGGDADTRAEQDVWHEEQVSAGEHKPISLNLPLQPKKGTSALLGKKKKKKGENTGKRCLMEVAKRASFEAMPFPCS